MKLFKPGDILLGLILIGMGHFVMFWFDPGGTDSQKVLVQINDNVKYELTLSKEQTIRLKEFDPPVEIEIHNNAIRIIRNDCVQKICLKMGYISKPGEMIVCVPKKILIYIPFSNDQHRTIKAITG